MEILGPGQQFLARVMGTHFVACDHFSLSFNSYTVHDNIFSCSVLALLEQRARDQRNAQIKRSERLSHVFLQLQRDTFVMWKAKPNGGV